MDARQVAGLKELPATKPLHLRRSVRRIGKS